MSYRSYHIAIGLLRYNGDILLVQQQGENDPLPYWVLPGGLIEPGESIIEALNREIQEETGLCVDKVGRLVYCTQILHPQAAMQTVAFLFEVDTWHGTLGPRDPDQEIVQVAWTSLADALEKLQAIGWRGMRDPLLAYLRGEAPTGSTWLYHQVEQEQALIARIPS